MSHAGPFDGDGLTGVRVGVVADTDDPEGRGRVRLRFPWRAAEDRSRWARVATPMAGPDCGVQFRPAVDDEVLVAFAGGDIHRPFVVGSLWNGEHAPPESDPADDPTIRTITTRAGHRVDFADGDGGGVSITTAGGHRIDLDDGGERIEITDGDSRIRLDGEAGELSISAADCLTLSAPTVEIDAGDRLTADAGRLSLAADSTLSLSSSGQLKTTSTGGTSLSATGPLSISGSLISLN